MRDVHYYFVLPGYFSTFEYWFLPFDVGNQSFLRNGKLCFPIDNNNPQEIKLNEENTTNYPIKSSIWDVIYRSINKIARIMRITNDDKYI